MTAKNGSKTITEAFTKQMGKGRPKGVVNKITAEAKEVIAQAAEGIGGVDRLIDWAKESPENEAKFWTAIYPRLIPVMVANAPGETFKVEQAHEDADAFRRRLFSQLVTGPATSGTGITEH